LSFGYPIRTAAARERSDALQVASMISQPPRAGVCIIRLEHDGARLRISLRLSADVANRSAERQHRFTDVDRALEAVRDFMRSFAQDRADPRRGDSGPGGDLPPTRP
jgi:hypothetical protein